MMKLRFVMIAAVIATLAAGCTANGNGRTESLLPGPGPVSHAEGVTVSMGRPGDRWLEIMSFLRIERAARDGQNGYQVTYAAAGGGTFSLFWSRNRIDLGGALPPQRRMDLPLGNGNYLYYPYTLTAESAPRLYRAIQLIEHEYAREADGWITATQWFAMVASMGPPPGRIPPRLPPLGTSIPAARVVKGGFKAFTKDNFRENLGRLTGGIPEGAHAHHVLPQEFAKKLEKIGINVHEPRFGAWWEANAHLKAANAYSNEWREFFRVNETPSIEDVLQVGRDIASKYGLQIYF